MPKKIQNKKDFAKLSIGMLLAGGVLFVVGLPLSFILIGIPFVIAGIVIMAIGALGLIASPFVKIKTA